MSQNPCDDENPSQPTVQGNQSGTQPSSQEDQWQSEQKSYWERQIRISEQQTRISIWLNGITLSAAAAAGVTLYFLSVQTSDLSVQTNIAKTTAQTAIDQLGMMKTSLQTTERAWVTVKGITLENLMVAGQEPVAVAGFYNSGHSPALQLTLHHFHQIVPGLAAKDKPDFRRIADESLAVVGPKSKMMSTKKYLSVTMEEMSNMAAGRAHLYSYGLIQYRDIFNTDHWTMFCYRSRDLSDRNLVACSEWNEVDKK